MSEGPIRRERLATTAAPIPRIRKGDKVTIVASDSGVVWDVLECDGSIATLGLHSGSRLRRFCRDLAKVTP